MLDLKLLVIDVENLVKLHDPDAYTLITLAVSVFADEYTSAEIAKAFNDAKFETTVSDEHLFLSIDGVKLRVPVRPLAKGDNDDSSQPNKKPPRSQKVRTRHARPSSPDS